MLLLTESPVTYDVSDEIQAAFEQVTSRVFEAPEFEAAFAAAQAGAMERRPAQRAFSGAEFIKGMGVTAEVWSDADLTADLAKAAKHCTMHDDESTIDDWSDARLEQLVSRKEV